MNLVEWFEKGLTPEQYINGMNVNKEGLETILQKFEVPTEDEAFLAKVQAENLRVIVLTEDWCGDAMLNVPILLKLAEKTDMHVITRSKLRINGSIFNKWYGESNSYLYFY